MAGLQVKLQVLEPLSGSCQTQAHQVPNFMVAEVRDLGYPQLLALCLCSTLQVPVQEYGDKENDDLRDKRGCATWPECVLCTLGRFKLSKEDFPAFFLLGEARSSAH